MIDYIIFKTGIFLGLVLGIGFGIVLARPDLVNRVREKIRPWLSRLLDNKGSIEVPPVSVNVLVKYLLRFGIPLAGVIGLIALLKADTISVVLYKCCLILTGFILAEAIWVIGYKYIFGKIEKEGISEYDRRSIMLFRGMLYAAIILGLTAGL